MVIRVHQMLRPRNSLAGMLLDFWTADGKETVVAPLIYEVTLQEDVDRWYYHGIPSIWD